MTDERPVAPCDMCGRKRKIQTYHLEPPEDEQELAELFFYCDKCADELGCGVTPEQRVAFNEWLSVPENKARWDKALADAKRRHPPTPEQSNG